MMNNKYIAVTIQNYVQFYSIKNVLDEMIKNGLNIDLYVPIAKDDWGLTEMFNDIYNHLKKEGYVVRRKPIKRKYKILLEPYPMEYYFSFDYEYRLKYKYSAISAKPFPTYRECDNFCYDAILCYSTYEADVLSVYSKTYLVGKPLYSEFKKDKIDRKKKILLYLPTYGDLNSIFDISSEISELRKKYYIITKAHHGTNYFNYENNKMEILKNMFDEFYDSTVSLETLLKRADIVLSDNSGSIFEALYTYTPVAIFSKNLEKCSLDDFKSYQYNLVKKDILPYTDDIKKIPIILEKALSSEYIKKQRELSNKIFPFKGKKGLETFKIIINNYLNDNIDVDNFKLHRIFLKNYTELNNSLLESKNTILEYEEKYKELENSYGKLKKENYNLNYKLSDYEKGKLYKLSTKMYSIMAKVRRNKK